MSARRARLSARSAFSVASRRASPARVVADEDLANDALLVDEQHRRQRADAVGAARVAVLVDDDAVAHLIPLGEDGGLLGVVGRDADDGEPLRAELVLQRAEPRREHAARTAPRRPEVEEHDAPAQLRDRRRRAAERRDLRPGRRRCADEVHLEDLVARRTRGEDDGRGRRACRGARARRTTVSPTLCCPTARVTCPGAVVFVPSTPTMRSPARRPALSAGEPRTTCSTVTPMSLPASICTPSHGAAGSPRGACGGRRWRRCGAGAEEPRRQARRHRAACAPRETEDGETEREHGRPKECARHLDSLTHATIAIGEKRTATKATWRHLRVSPRETPRTSSTDTAGKSTSSEREGRKEEEEDEEEEAIRRRVQSRSRREIQERDRRPTCRDDATRRAAQHFVSSVSCPDVQKQ